MPITARKQLNELPDNVLTKVTLFYYSDPRDALIKGWRCNEVTSFRLEVMGRDPNARGRWICYGWKRITRVGPIFVAPVHFNGPLNRC
jgi:hypothetical protein